MSHNPTFTMDEYRQWANTTGADPNIPAGHLRAAGLLVSHYLNACAPTGRDGQEAIREATFAQAAYWQRSSIQPLSEAINADTKIVSSSSLLGASMSYAGAEGVRQARNLASERLCLESRLILAQAGFHPSQPRVVG